MKKLMIMAALPVLAMAAPQVAMAEESNTAHASYAGLDLTTEAGQKELKHRIEQAAKSVCSDNRVRGAAEANRRSACMKVALKKSEQQFAAAISDARYGG